MALRLTGSNFLGDHSSLSKKAMATKDDLGHGNHREQYADAPLKAVQSFSHILSTMRMYVCVYIYIYTVNQDFCWVPYVNLMISIVVPVEMGSISVDLLPRPAGLECAVHSRYVGCDVTYILFAPPTTNTSFSRTSTSSWTLDVSTASKVMRSPNFLSSFFVCASDES